MKKTTNMKKMTKGLLFTVFATLTLCSLNSCLGDKGNMTTSYGTGPYSTFTTPHVYDWTR